MGLMPSSEGIFVNLIDLFYRLAVTTLSDDYANTRVELDNDYDPIPISEHIIIENKRRSQGNDFQAYLRAIFPSKFLNLAELSPT